ncbi:MAG: DUF3341 domain-containing protein [Gammaproteobacteria bacterium]|nr:DUF3341 domain-containing protein [Gammaproteobacteria bacterium]
MATHRILAMFKGFDDAIACINEVKAGKLKGSTVDDLTVMSPIEHPDIDEILGQRPVNVQKFTFIGALFGVSFGFFFLSSAQASFLVQPQGGKPVVPFPSNFVLMYEMLIFFGVWTTVFTFLFLAGLLKKRDTLYSEKLTVDQVGLIVEVEDKQLDSARSFFNGNKAVELREEKV